MVRRQLFFFILSAVLSSKFNLCSLPSGFFFVCLFSFLFFLSERQLTVIKVVELWKHNALCFNDPDDFDHCENTKVISTCSI